jgi:hypothetical protein
MVIFGEKMENDENVWFYEPDSTEVSKLLNFRF